MLSHLMFLTFYLLVFVLDMPVVLQYALLLHALTIVYGYFANKKMPDPLCIYAVYVAWVSFSNVIMIGNVETNTVTSYYSYIVPEKINIASLIWCVGNTALFLGLTVFDKASLSKIDIYIYDKKKLQNIFLVMLLFSFKSFFIGELRLGALSVILGIVATTGLVFFARLWGTTDDPRYRSYALTLYIVQTTVSVLYSYLRAEMLLPSICILLGYFLGKRSLKLLFSAKIIPILLVAFIFNTFFDSFGNNRTSLSVGINRLTELDVANNQTSIYQDEEKQNIVARSSILPQITSLVALVDTKGFYNGAAIAPLFIALVPRFLWPEKPLIGLGAWFATEIGQGMQTEKWYSNSINMTIPGHLYLDFGWTGIILGCFFMGLFITGIWNSTKFNDSPYNVTGIVLGGYVLLICTSGIGADLQIIISLLSYYLIFLLIKKLV